MTKPLVQTVSVRLGSLRSAQVGRTFYRVDWNIAGFVAAALAAIAAVLGLWQHRKVEKQRRLLEIADLVEELRSSIQWGPVHGRDAIQGKLKTRLRGFALPHTTVLATTPLQSDKGLALARAAVDEVTAELARRAK